MSTEKSPSLESAASLAELLSEAVALLRVLRPLAERALACDALWEQPATRLTDDRRRRRESLENQAIVLVGKDGMNRSQVAATLGVPISTLKGWKHLNAALEQRNGVARIPRRGILNRGEDGEMSIDAIDE